MPKNILNLNSLKRTTALLTSLSLVYGCAVTQATGPNGVKAPGTNNKGFQIKNAPYCPFPSWEYPTPATSASGSGTSSVFHRLYGTFEGPIGGFSFGSLRVGTDPEGIVKIEALIQGNSGPNYYTTGAAVTLNVDSLDHDFQFTKAMDVGYSSSNDTATTMFEGPGAVNVSYVASTGTWTVHVSGHGDLIPVGFLAFGTADFEATATYETGACNLPRLKVTADPPFISPANGDGKFDTGNIHVSSTSTQAWTLSIAGNKPGPAGQDGFPTKGDACSWSTSGTEPEKDIEWNGTCDDRTTMVDGEYEIKLASAGFEDTTSIKIDNTPPQFGAPLQTLLPGNEVRYSVDVRDPEVNQVASGLSSTKLNLEVLSNGQPVAVSAPSLTAGAYAPGQGQHYQLEFTGPALPGATLQILAEDNVANRNQNPLQSCNRDGSPVMLPHDLDLLLNQLNNLNLADPNLLQEIQQIQNKLENIQGQLTAAGFITQSFHTLTNGETANAKKIQNLLAKKAVAEQDLQNAQDGLDQQLSPFDSQIQELVSLVDNHYHYQLHKYQGVFLPQSLEQYKNKVDRAETIFYNLSTSNNTYQYFFAGCVTILETQLYRMLIDATMFSELATTHSNDESAYSYNFPKIKNITNSKELINLLARRIQNQSTKLRKLQANKQIKLDKIMNGVFNKTPYKELLQKDATDIVAPDDFQQDSTLFQTQSLENYSIQRLGGATVIDNEASSPTGSGSVSGGIGEPAGGLNTSIPDTGGAVVPTQNSGFTNSHWAPPPGSPVTEQDKYNLFQTAMSISGDLARAFQGLYQSACGKFWPQQQQPSPSGSPTPFPTPYPTPQPTNLNGPPDSTTDGGHRTKLRARLSSAGEGCVGDNANPTRTNPPGNKPEQAHHIVPLNYRGMGMAFIHSLLAACKIDIDDPENGICLDNKTHDQTKANSPRTDDNYVQQIMIQLSLGVYNPFTEEVDCQELYRRLALIKNHLSSQNTLSQRIYSACMNCQSQV